MRKSVVRELALQLRNGGLLFSGTRCPCMDGKKYVKLKKRLFEFLLRVYLFIKKRGSPVYFNLARGQGYE